MLRNSLIAIAAAATLGLALAPAAEAKTRIRVGFHVGHAHFGHVYRHGYVRFAAPRLVFVDGGCRSMVVKHKKVKANGKLKVWYSKKLVCY